MKIDFHAHAFPEAFFRKLKEYYPDEVILQQNPQGHLIGFWAGTPLPAWDHGRRIEDMNTGGVEIEILSNPSMYIRVDAHSPELCRIVNDMYAEACRQSPDRFKAFANLPFNNINDALAELDRVLAAPGFVGVLITSNVGGKYLHTPEFIPFWDEVARRRVPVFMHPKPPPGYQDDDIAPLLAFPADTTLSTMKLLYSGLFERCPDVILILAHLGGTLPFLARRIDIGFEDPHFSDKYRQIPHCPSHYMPKLYFDTALGWHKPAFDCARALVGIDHLVYGSDYFMIDSAFMQRTNEFLESLDLSKSEKEKIYSGNALRFLQM
ncbi:MAG: amidohydrolase family protein [Candidatus Binatia bacterium]